MDGGTDIENANAFVDICDYCEQFSNVPWREHAHQNGFIGRLPCYNTIFNILEAEATTEVLQHLVDESAESLKSIESSCG